MSQDKKYLLVTPRGVIEAKSTDESLKYGDLGGLLGSMEDVVPVSELSEGNLIKMNIESVRIPMSKVRENLLEKSESYRKLYSNLFVTGEDGKPVVNFKGNHVTVFRKLLLEGAFETNEKIEKEKAEKNKALGITEESTNSIKFEEDIEKTLGTIEEGYKPKVITFATDIIESKLKKPVRSTVNNWLNGTVSPRKWSVFKELAGLNDEFQKIYDSKETNSGFSYAYKGYMANTLDAIASIGVSDSESRSGFDPQRKATFGYDKKEIDDWAAITKESFGSLVTSEEVVVPLLEIKEVDSKANIPSSGRKKQNLSSKSLSTKKSSKSIDYSKIASYHTLLNCLLKDAINEYSFRHPEIFEMDSHNNRIGHVSQIEETIQTILLGKKDKKIFKEMDQKYLKGVKDYLNARKGIKIPKEIKDNLTILNIFDVPYKDSLGVVSSFMEDYENGTIDKSKGLEKGTLMSVVSKIKDIENLLPEEYFLSKPHAFFQGYIRTNSDNLKKIKDNNSYNKSDLKQLKRAYNVLEKTYGRLVEDKRKIENTLKDRFGFEFHKLPRLLSFFAWMDMKDDNSVVNDQGYIGETTFSSFKYDGVKATADDLRVMCDDLGLGEAYKFTNNLNVLYSNDSFKLLQEQKKSN